MCPAITKRWLGQFTPTRIGSPSLVWSLLNYQWLVCFFLTLIHLANLASLSSQAPSAVSKKSVKCLWLDERAYNSGGFYERELFHPCEPANAHKVLDQ